MSYITTVIVSILSTISIILQAIHLSDYHPDDPYSIVAIVSTASMFVLPWGKKYIPYIGEWLFILASLTSLISQAMTYGKYVDTDAHDILLISVVLSVAGAFIGHYIAKKNTIRHGNSMVNKLKMLLIVSPLIIYLLDAKIDPKPIAFDVLLIFTILCIPTYAFMTFVLITRNKYEIQRSYIQFMDYNVSMEYLFHKRRKPINLIVSAIPLTTFSVFVGENPSTVNILILALFIGALALEHINALYFD